MINRKHMNAALRASAATIVVGIALSATGAIAQAVPAETGVPATTGAPDGTTNTSEIIVTGSRIARPDLQQASPVAVITQQAIALRGSTNIETVLNDLPQVTGDTTGASNNPGGGVATVNLRNLGAQRTLVLVNGRRYMSYDVNQVVDLNTIPQALIERVDVVTGGRSAVYGSDAVAGVVNFILKQNFQGAEFHSQYELSGKGDGARWDVNGTIGGNFDDDKGNATISIDYFKRKSIFAGDRKYSANALIDNGDGTTSFGGSGSVPQGRFNIPGSGALLGTGSNNNVFNPDGSAHAYSPTADAYNYNPINYLQVPQERFLVSAQAHYDVSDAFKPYVEGQFVNNRVPNQLAATPIGNSTPFGANGVLGPLTVQTNSPFLAPSVQAAYRALDTNGDGYISVPSFGFRTTQIGPRKVLYDRYAYRILAGVKGDIGHGFSYDAYYMYARTHDSQTQDGNISISNFLAATQTAFQNPNTGATSAFPIAGGTLVCASADARAAGCVPANIFGQGNLSAAAQKYLSIGATNIENYTTQVASAAITNSNLFDLGAGGVGLAFGAEWRSESGSVRPDTFLATGNVAGFNPQQATSGRYSVRDLFAEVNIPLLADTFIKKLEINGSARYSHYSNSPGNVFTYTGGALLQVISDVGFRGQYSRAIRGPSVNELFLGQTVGFNGQADPCGNSGLAPEIAARCADVAGFNGVGAALVGNPSVNNSDDVNPPTFQSGNRNLKEERATTYTFGGIFTPTFLPGFSLTADYYNIKIKGFIGQAGQANIFNACYTQGISSYCSLFTRNSLGQVDSITDTLLNSGGLKTNGVDVGAGYARNLNLFGGQKKLSLAFNGSYLRKYAYTPIVGLPITNECAGKFGTICGYPTPKWKHTARATMDFGGFAVSGAWRFLGKVGDDDPDTDYAVEKIKAQNYFDLAVSVDAADQLSFTAGVNNFLDKKPPLVASAQNGGNGDQSNTFPAVYDVLGRYLFVGANFRF